MTISFVRALRSSLFAFALAAAGCTVATYTDGETTARTPTHTEGEGDPRTPPPSGQAGASCGGIAGLPCASDLFCDLGAQCHMPDAMGTCTPRTRACTRDYRPVCGCDGRTYGNACSARASGVSVLHPGECP